MLLEGLHEKEIFTEKYPFRLELNLDENFNYPYHWHSAVELVYVFEGLQEAEVNGRKVLLGEKDIMIIAGGDIHGFHTGSDKSKRAFIQFDISMLDGFGDIRAIKPYLSETRHIPSNTDHSLQEALEDQILKIIHAYEKKEFAYALYLNARIFDILVILSRSLVHTIHSEASKYNIKKTGGLEKINQTFKYIESNYPSEITLHDAAKAAGFSVYHFSRIFKEATGKSFLEYINEFRIKQSEKYLSSANATVAEAAYAAGFNSIATFNRLFKEIKGCTPSEYKKMRV